MEASKFKLVKLVISFSEPRAIAVNTYTGKLIKTLLMVANPELATVFSHDKVPSPKPLHTTPLYEENRGKVTVLYPKYVVRQVGEEVKNISPMVSPIMLEAGKEYAFYVGYHISYENEVIKAISKLIAPTELEFGDYRLKLRLLRFQYVDVNIPKEFNYVKVKLMAPALFRDPFAKLAQLDDEKRRFVPFPPFMFSVNVYELFREKYKTNIIKLAYSLIESHHNMETFMKVYYRYDDKVLPGIIGYGKFFLRKGLKDATKEMIKEVLTHASIMGIGTGRAAGFGHVSIETG